jgi:hypothetical protein
VFCMRTVDILPLDAAIARRATCFR